MGLNQGLAVMLLLATTLQLGRSADGDICPNDRKNDLSVRMAEDGECRKICADWLSWPEATVLCRELGRPTYDVRVYSGKLGQGLVPLLPLQCKGDERNLSQCYRPVKMEFCHRGRAILHCLSQNESKEASVTILKPDSTPITDIKGYLNHNVTVQCKVPSRKSPSMWFKWTVGNHTISLLPLVILNLTRDMNEKLLTCQVYLKDKVIGSNTTKLDVYYPPNVDMDDEETYVMETGAKLPTPLNLGNPPADQITWYQLGGTKVIEADETVTKKHTGLYIVHLQNQMNVNFGTPSTGNGVQKIRLKVLDAAECGVKQVYIGQGENRTLHCLDKSGWNVVNANWSTSGLVQNTIVNASTALHNKTLHCNVSYTVTGSTLLHKSCNIKVFIADKEESVSVKSGMNGTESEELQNVTNINNFNWTRVEHDEATTSFPNIFTITKQDAGKYLGKMEDKTLLVQLNVKYKPNVTCRNERLIPRGADIELKCQVDAYPSPQVTWNNKRCKERYGALTCEINRVEFRDAGNYSCIARNSEGSDICVVTLQVFEPPTPTNKDPDDSGLTVVIAVLSVLLFVVLVLLGISVVFYFKQRANRGEKNSEISLPVLPRPVRTADPEMNQEVYENT